ncbi:DUF2914 domain-containing protein [Pseudoalteromonas xiamenensis]|jgi:hypothetical protein
MTQKLVIRTKTNVAASQPPVEAVSYEWHWRRIWAALLSFGLLIGAGGYALLLSVNADELTPENRVETQHSALDLAQASDSLEQDAELDNVSVADEDDTANTEVVTIDKAVFDEDTSTSEPSDVLQDELGEEPAAPSLVSIDNGNETPPNQIESADSPTDVNDPAQFSSDATVATLAVGAQIDTSKVSRAVLTTGVIDREPVDVLKTDVSNSQFSDKLYFFTEVKALQGTTIHHVWYFQDVIMADIPLSISAARFRTYSLKHVLPEQLGDWRIDVVKETGELIAQKQFRIHAAQP